MSSCELVTALRENMSPGLMSSSLRSSASGTTIVPASLMSETLKTSPSLTFTVMYMLSFSGAMVTCVDSIWKFA